MYVFRTEALRTALAERPNATSLQQVRRLPAAWPVATLLRCKSVQSDACLSASRVNFSLLSVENVLVSYNIHGIQVHRVLSKGHVSTPG